MMKKRIFGTMGAWDRFLRLVVAELFFIGAYFFTSGWQLVVLAIFGTMFLVLALSGKREKVEILPETSVDANNTSAKTDVIPDKHKRKRVMWMIIALFLIAAVGSVVSAWYTKHIFLNRFFEVEKGYRLTMESLLKADQSASATHFLAFQESLSSFSTRYSQYLPYGVNGDALFSSDMKKLLDTVDDAHKRILAGNLETARLLLQETRPTVRDVVRRNNLSSTFLAVLNLGEELSALEKAIAQNDMAAASRYRETILQTLAHMSKEKSLEESLNNIREQIEKLDSFLRAEGVATEAATIVRSAIEVYDRMYVSWDSFQ